MNNTADGVPSPSPQFPQEIKNVEGRSCRNLFDGEWTGSVSTNFIPVFAGKNYKYSEQNTAEGMNYRFYSSKESSEYTQTNIGYNSYYTPQSDGYVKLYKTNTSKTECQLEEGTVVTPYEEYFEGKRLEFNIENKNLAKEEFDQYYKIQASGSDRILAISNHRTSQIIKVKPNTTYVIDGDFSGFTDNVCRARCFNNYPVLGKVDLTTAFAYNNTKFSITTDATTQYLLIYNSQDVSNINIPNMFVCELSYADNYEEHKQQMIPFPLAEGQKLMEEDYLADDGVHHVMWQAVLEGAEDWSLRTSGEIDGITYYRFSTRIDSNYKTRASFFSSIGNNNNYGSGTGVIRTKNIGINLLADSSNYIYLTLSSTTTVEELKSWLTEQYANGTPVIVEYELEEETIDPYTPAQAEAYQKLMNLKLYKGVNHIWTNTDGLEPNLQLTYYKSNKLRLDSIEARLELLEE